jgi:hypothetical protein
MGVATFSLVFATLHYYRCSLGGRMSDTERTLHARRADRFWLLGYTMMFLAPSLVLFLVRLRIVASVWLAFWLLYLFFVVRFFPRMQTPTASQMKEERSNERLSVSAVPVTLKLWFDGAVYIGQNGRVNFTVRQHLPCWKTPMIESPHSGIRTFGVRRMSTEL